MWEDWKNNQSTPTKYAPSKYKSTEEVFPINWCQLGQKSQS